MKIILFSENKQIKMFGIHGLETNQRELKLESILSLFNDEKVSRIIIERVSQDIFMVIMFNKRSVPVKEKDSVMKKIQVFKQLLQKKINS
ncbi:MAG: hypothetical protein ABGW69_00350 [Nanoarchaeota archaeon]